MEAFDNAPAGPPSRPFWRPLGWALLIPLLFTLGGWLAQYPHGLIVAGVAVALAALAVAATLAGGIWHRPGAAVLLSCAGIALTFFAGPGLYELYMTKAGKPVQAVVTKVEDRQARRGADMFCTVVETGGGRTVHHVSEQQNCSGDFEPLQTVTLRTDPAGLLKPRLPDGPGGKGDTALALEIAAGLFLVTGAAMFYAGRRRR
ncbi:hypothetical protein [Actinomadura violacea]|uniref:Integral membrane protein n=1 Tax=Actinomadura violacea TaxID=2819934 RepID=A0ABS3RVC5_9ACTN|nr:hypothetical protein [Actinomadura violacea]MBO2459984.1 hypothetical protein [Actinomadura violacea]